MAKKSKKGKRTKNQTRADTLARKQKRDEHKIAKAKKRGDKPEAIEAMMNRLAKATAKINRKWDKKEQEKEKAKEREVAAALAAKAKAEAEGKPIEKALSKKQRLTAQAASVPDDAMLECGKCKETKPKADFSVTALKTGFKKPLKRYCMVCCKAIGDEKQERNMARRARKKEAKKAKVERKKLSKQADKEKRKIKQAAKRQMIDQGKDKRQAHKMMREQKRAAKANWQPVGNGGFGQRKQQHREGAKGAAQQAE